MQKDEQDPEDCFGVDQFGHDWQMDWVDSDRPHPGFGGTRNIYGGYTSRCANCGELIDNMNMITQCKGKNGRDNS